MNTLCNSAPRCWRCSDCVRYAKRLERQVEAADFWLFTALNEFDLNTAGETKAMLEEASAALGGMTKGTRGTEVDAPAPAHVIASATGMTHKCDCYRCCDKRSGKR